MATRPRAGRIMPRRNSKLHPDFAGKQPLSWTWKSGFTGRDYRNRGRRSSRAAWLCQKCRYFASPRRSLGSARTKQMTPRDAGAPGVRCRFSPGGLARSNLVNIQTPDAGCKPALPWRRPALTGSEVAPICNRSRLSHACSKPHGEGRRLGDGCTSA